MKFLLDYARENELSFVAVKNDEIFYKSQDFGIRPAFEFYKLYKDIENVMVYDKIIGQGAARLLKETKVLRVETSIISSAAIEILKNHLDLRYNEEVAYILNRDGTDYCPIEKLSMKNQFFDAFYNSLCEFIG